MKKYIAIADSYGYLGRYWKKHMGEDKSDNHVIWKDGMPLPNKHFKLAEVLNDEKRNGKENQTNDVFHEKKEVMPGLEDSFKQALGVISIEEAEAKEVYETPNEPVIEKQKTKPKQQRRGRRK